MKRGFTLLETIVALGIAAIALSFFIAAFAPATLGIKKASRAQEAKNLVSALEAEMGIVRNSEGSGGSSLYDNPFDKAFQWVKRNGANGSGLLVAFQYRANSQQATDTDGNYPAYTGDVTGTATSQAMILQNRVCPIENIVSPPSVTAGYSDADRYAQVEGGAFVMELTQMVYDNNGALVVHDDRGEVVDPNNASGAAVSAYDSVTGTTLAFPEAVLLYQVDVYFLKSSDPSYLSGTIDGVADFDATLGKPIYSTQLGVFR